MMDIRMKQRHCYILIFLIIQSLPSFSQKVLLDVKTHFSDKSDLHFIKLATIHVFDTSTWARTVEIEEDFSLWLNNLKRIVHNDTAFVSLELELHSPSFINEGQLLAKNHVALSVPLMVQDSIGSAIGSKVNTYLVDQLRNSKILTRLLRMLGIASTSVMGTDLVNILIIPVFIETSEKLGRTPSPQETLEGTLLASTILIETQDMIKPFQKTNFKK